MTRAIDRELARRVTRTDPGGAAVFLLELPGTSDDVLAGLRESASAERLERAARFRFQADAIRCLAAEWLLRHALEREHRLERADVVVERDERDKPFLVNRPDLWFNLTHSGAWVACAIDARPVGVDVEVVRLMSDPPARQFMSPSELDAYHRVPPDAQPDWFFRLWTLKESVLKAAGTGLAFSARRITILPGGDGLRTDGAPPAPEGCEWRPVVLALRPPVHGAVCVASPVEPPSRQELR